MRNKEFELDALIRDNVRGLSPYSSARDEYVSDGSQMIFLDANENPFETGVNRYPDPYQRGLKALLAEQKGVDPGQLLLGNGSDEVLDLIFRAFCEPHRDNVIILPPTYGMYQVLAGINAVEHREVLLDHDFQPNLPEILARVGPRTKLIFLCSPNNPTGNLLDRDRLLDLLESFPGLVVVDEAYIDFAPEESWVARLGDHPNLLVVQTLSKAYGLAGIRLGICYGSPEIIAVLGKIKPPYNVNQLTQQRALQRLGDLQGVRGEVARILAERQRLEDSLRALDFVEAVYPSDANFVLARVDDANRRYNQLLDQHVVVRNRSGQPGCGNTLRFTVGTPEENNQLIDLLKQL